jgi:hypothetical protein
MSDSAGSSYATQSEHMRQWYEKLAASGARYTCKGDNCTHSWKHLDQGAMVRHFNVAHGANILTPAAYTGYNKCKKRIRHASPLKPAFTACATFAVTPIGTLQGNTTARDHSHTFARPSARDKMDTALVDECVSTLEKFSKEMKAMLAGIRALTTDP